MSTQLNKDSGGYEHVSVMAPLERPRVHLTTDLDAVVCGMEHADLIDGLVVAVDHLHRKVGTKKYTKTVYLITAAETAIEAPDDLNATVEHMIKQDVSLFVVGIGFQKSLVDFDDGPAVKQENGAVVVKEEDREEEEEEEGVKQGNERMLRSIVRATQVDPQAGVWVGELAGRHGQSWHACDE